MFSSSYYVGLSLSSLASLCMSENGWIRSLTILNMKEILSVGSSLPEGSKNVNCV